MPNVTCSIDGCTGKQFARGWCSKHYSRWSRHGDPLWEPPAIPKFRPCSVDGCDAQLKAKGLCSPHLEKLRRYGSPTATPPKTQKTLDILAAGEQTCTRCKRILPLTEFPADRTRSRRVKTTCRPCGVDMNRDYVQRNTERVAAARRAYRQRLSDEQRARYNAGTAEWKKRNYAKVRDANHRRRAILRDGTVSEVDYDILWESSDGSCAICGKSLDRSTPWPSPDFASVDHIHPLSKGGSHTQNNLQYTCLSCNLRKHAKVETSTAIILP